MITLTPEDRARLRDRALNEAHAEFGNTEMLSVLDALDEARTFAELWKECARGHAEGERFAVGHINAWRRVRNGWRSRARSAEATLERVRELHAQSFISAFDGISLCKECGMPAPCATVRTLEGEA